jgi:peptidoglycan/LPS O-acetylase OafA/YrhL
MSNFVFSENASAKGLYNEAKVIRDSCCATWAEFSEAPQTPLPKDTKNHTIIWNKSRKHSLHGLSSVQRSRYGKGLPCIQQSVSVSRRRIQFLDADNVLPEGKIVAQLAILANARETEMKYRPDIDGLRAVAVLPVVFYHAGLSGVPGGFVGVDVFFVISGYLITRIIHNEMLEGRFSMLHFYERRARRILPALLTVMAASLAIGWVWLSPADYDALARSAGSVLIFLSNVWFWQNSGSYFDGAADYLPLLHTWSLAIEEQFYILFPLLLLGLVRMGRRATLWVTAALVLGSLVLAVWASPRMPSASFYLLPTRIWELGVGSLLALGLAPGTAPRWLRESVGMLGLAAIAYSVTQYDGATVFPGLAALLPVLGAAALIWVGGAGGSLAGRLLSWQPVVLVGLLSYSLYLWHWPIMAFARNRLTDVHLPPAWQVGTIVLSLLMAWASWRYVERPFRAKQISRGKIFIASGAGMALLGAATAAIVMTGGAEQRFEPNRLALERALTTQALRDWTCEGTAPQRCVFSDTVSGAAATWALWGDSHAAALLPAIGALAAEQNRTVYVATKGGCPPLPGLVRTDMPPFENATCARLNSQMLETLRTDPNIQTVFLAARWPIYVEGTFTASEGNRAFALRRAGEPATPANNPGAVAAALETVVADLRAAGRQVVLLGPVPEMPWDVTARLRAAVLFDTALPRDIPDLTAIQPRQERSEVILSMLAQLHDGVLYVPLARAMCQEVCSLMDDGVPRYTDNNHLTVYSARRLVTPALRAALSDAFPAHFQDIPPQTRDTNEDNP